MLELDVVEHDALITDLGEALMTRELWQQALQCFACIQECDDVRGISEPAHSWPDIALCARTSVDEQIEDSPELILSMAVCHHMLEAYGPAEEYMRWGE